jgi:Ca-activated chloride channel family protein
MYIDFTNKIYLIFLFAIPAIIFLHFYGLRNIKGKSLKFANFQAIARVKGIDLYSKSVFILLLNLILVSLLVLAVSGITLYTEMTASHFSYVIAIDSSESMEATDLKPNRLTAAKLTAINFVKSLPFESYIGVLSFSGNSKVETKMTKNKQLVIDGINAIEVSPIGGTDINEAVWNSMRLLRNEKNKAIIILSDGQINVGELDKTIEETLAQKVIIHAVGIGTVEGGEVDYGLSKLDENTLKSLAYNTEGKYFNVQETKELAKTFSELTEVTKRVGDIPLSIYFIMAAIVFFLIKQYLVTTNRVNW